MSSFNIEVQGNNWRFEPGERVNGQVAWALDAAASALEIRLVWFTSGKGTTDRSVVQTQHIERPADQGSQAFSFLLPHGPCSFSGKLITITWAIEVAALPRGASEARDIIVAPGRMELGPIQGIYAAPR